jgi:hypothetical protein
MAEQGIISGRVLMDARRADALFGPVVR